MQPQSVSQVLLSPLLEMYGPPQSCKRTIPLTGYGGRRGGFPHSEKTVYQDLGRAICGFVASVGLWPAMWSSRAKYASAVTRF